MYQIRWMIGASVTPPAPLENATESRRPGAATLGRRQGACRQLASANRLHLGGCGEYCGTAAAISGPLAAVLSVI
jgi:hypothetical protein